MKFCQLVYFADFDSLSIADIVEALVYTECLAIVVIVWTLNVCPLLSL